MSKHPFSHRHNEQAETYDSICMTCFMTIASTPKESDLAALEKFHHCTGFSLSHILHPEVPEAQK